MQTNRFWNKNGSEVQGLSNSKSTGVLAVVKHAFGPLPLICVELLVGQTQNRVNFEFESQGQSPHETKGILAMVFYTSGPNSVIIA